jgi:cell wall-associated NlpC family hydrolase
VRNRALRLGLALAFLTIGLATGPGSALADGSGNQWRPEELTWYGISQRRVNDTRADAGLPLLAAEGYLWSLARERARDMLERGYLAATTPEGLDAGAYMAQDGARYAGWTELRAEDASADAETTVSWRVISGLLNDAGGRAAVVGPFDRFGVAFAERPGRRVFVILLATAEADAPPPDTGGAVATLAERYIGAPYRWGGGSPAGFDCSGFVRYVVEQATGVRLGRDVTAQAGVGAPVAPADLRPGDIIFQQNTYKRGLSHVGIYIGGGRMISAETERTGVRVAAIWDSYWGPRFHSARRVA